MSSLKTSWLLLVFLPLVNFGPIPGGKLTFAHLISFGLLVVWAARDQLRLAHTAFLWCGLFLLLVASNVLLGAISRSSLGQLTQLVNYALMMGCMLVAYTLAMRDDISPGKILDDYFRVGVAYAGVSLLIFLYGMVNNAFIYAVTDFFNIANTFDRGGISAEFGEVLPRVTGLSPEPAYWSIYLSTVLAVGVSRGKSALTGGMLLVVLVLGLTLARTGAVTVAMLLLYILARRAPLAFAWMLGFIAIAAMFLLNIDISGADASVTQRFGSLIDGWKAFTSAPIFGVGWGGFREYSIEQRLDYPVIFNYYLQVAAEGGIVGLYLLLSVIVSLYRHTPSPYRMVPVVIFVAWLAAGVYNLAYAWFLFGVLLAAGRKEAAAQPPALMQQPA